MEPPSHLSSLELPAPVASSCVQKISKEDARLGDPKLKFAMALPRNDKCPGRTLGI